MIDKTKGMIISYPRSGLNWMRYCIEYFSGKRTPGRVKLVPDGEIAVYRTHNVTKNEGTDSCCCRFYGKTGKPLHQRVILLLRDYRETLIKSGFPAVQGRTAKINGPRYGPGPLIL